MCQTVPAIQTTTTTTLNQWPSSRTTPVSRYQNVSILDITGAKDGDGGDNWSYKKCKAPVTSSPPTNQHPTFYRPDALPVA